MHPQFRCLKTETISRIYISQPIYRFYCITLCLVVLKGYGFMLSDSKITVQIHLFQLRMGQPMVTYMSTKQKLENLAQGFPGCDNIFHNTGDNSRTSSQISTTKTQPQQLQKSCLFEEGVIITRQKKLQWHPWLTLNLFLSNCCYQHPQSNKCRVSKIISFMSCDIDYMHMIIKIYQKNKIYIAPCQLSYMLLS